MSSIHLSTGAHSLTSSGVGGGRALSVQTNTSNALFVDGNGNVGIGTGVPRAKMDIPRGLIVNLGDSIKTVYTDRGFTAASFQGGYNTGSLTGPIAGVYTFTIGNADTNAGLTVSNFASSIILGSSYEISFTASSLDNGVNFAMECPSFNSIYTSPALTSTMTLYTTNVILSTNDFTFRIYGGSGKSIRWNAFTVKRLDSTLTGAVGIGTTNPILKLHLHDASYAAMKYSNNNYSWNTGIGSAEYFVYRGIDSTGVYLAWGATGWSGNSDRRNKKNIKEINYGLNELLLLKPVRFDYKTDDSESSKRIGFIAQDMLEVIPECVDISNPERYGITPTELIPVLVKAIQEQQVQINALKAHLNLP